MTIKAAILLTAAFAFALPARAEDAPDFKGKTVTFLIGDEANGGFDIYGRLFARFLGTHLPGNPTVIVKNMPGAGGLLAANAIYNVSPHDGTEIGLIGQVAAINQVLGKSGVHYDVRKLTWLGRITSNTQILHTWYRSGIKTIQDVFEHQCIVGGTSAASSSVIFPHMLNDFVGTKFKAVSGYKGPASATLAMEAGEVDAVVRPWNSLKATSAEWLKDKKIFPILQLSLKRNPELPDVPAVVELAHDQEQRQVLGLFASGSDVGYPVIAPPGLTPALVSTLRTAFDATMKDPDFLAAAREEHEDLDPMSGAELQKINDDALNVPQSVVEQAKKYSGGS